MNADLSNYLQNLQFDILAIHELVITELNNCYNTYTEQLIS